MSDFPRIDCHVHLQDPVMFDRLGEVVEQAREAGVRWMICNAVEPDDWDRVLGIARQFPEVVPFFGLHPWHVKAAKGDWLGELERRLQAIPSGVGEIGLDRWIKDIHETAQQQAFCAQLDLARRLGRPVQIHCLKAMSWLLDVLRVDGPPPAGMMIHGFGGPGEYIEPLAAMGAYFSFAGNVLDPQRRRARAAVAAVPLDRLLVETDAPDMLPPRPFCPYHVGSDIRRRNSPANLPYILRGLAQLRGLAEEELAAQVWTNAQRLFGPLLAARREIVS